MIAIIQLEASQSEGRSTYRLTMGFSCPLWLRWSVCSTGCFKKEGHPPGCPFFHRTFRGESWPLLGQQEKKMRLSFWRNKQPTHIYNEQLKMSATRFSIT
jgi:hypothetical protein